MALVGCSLSTSPDDGLSVEPAGGYDFSEAPLTANDAGVDTGAPPSQNACKKLDAFTEFVRPVFMERCTECHDGTKIKAALKLGLFLVDDLSQESQSISCEATLLTTNKTDPEQSTIFTFLDPQNTATKHDFKFETVDEFTEYRADVMRWLSVELASGDQEGEEPDT